MNALQLLRRSASTRRPSGGQPVVAAPTLAGLLHPPAGNEPAPFQPVEDGIERGRLKRDAAGGARGNLLPDFVPMSGLAFELRQDEQFGRALLQRGVDVCSLTYV